MKDNNLKVRKQVKFTFALLNDITFFLFLHILSFKILRVTGKLLLHSQYLFFDTEMSIVVFEK